MTTRKQLSVSFHLASLERRGAASPFRGSAAAVATAAVVQPPQDALHPAGVQAADILHLWNLTLVVCGIVFAGVLVATLVALARKRRATVDDPPDMSMVTAPERRTRRVVISLSVLSCLVLVGLVVADVMTDRALSMLPVAQPVHIRLTGAQFWWRADYAAEDGSPAFTTANELHVPVGRPIIVSLNTVDVIHSFWVPNLHGKKDMLPGIPSTIEFRADKAGVYRGQCAQFCGAEHALMATRVVAEPEGAYAAWRAQQAKPAVADADALVLHGRQVFEQASCSGCHTVRGTSATGTNGPDLTHLMSRATLAAGVLANTPANLAAWVGNPQAIKPGTPMPAVPLTNADRDALVKWLATLQ